MKPPIRWAAEDSDASSALRETVLYAQRYEPAPDRVAALTAAVLAEFRPAPLPAAAQAVSSAKVAAACMGAVMSVGIGLGVWSALDADSSVSSGTATKTAAPVSAAPVFDARPVVEAAPPLAATPLGDVQPSSAPEAAAPAPFVDPRPLPARAIKRRARSVRSAIPDEASLLQGARRTRRQDPLSALRLLDEHTQHYPKSALHEERDALRIEIMRQVDPAAAKALAAKFDVEFPGSVYGRKHRP